MELHFHHSLEFPLVTPFCNGLLELALRLASLLLCSALSVDVASQISMSYLELRKSLDVCETLERSLILLLLFLQQVWLLCTRSTTCSARDLVHVAVLAQDYI